MVMHTVHGLFAHSQSVLPVTCPSFMLQTKLTASLCCCSVPGCDSVSQVLSRTDLRGEF